MTTELNTNLKKRLLQQLSAAAYGGMRMTLPMLHKGARILAPNITELDVSDVLKELTNLGVIHADPDGLGTGLLYSINDAGVRTLHNIP